MAIRLITTPLTTNYVLDSADILYVAKNMGVLYSGTTMPALSNRLGSDGQLDIRIDGYIISGATTAIRLANSITTSVGDEIAIGTSGLVVSADHIGILVNRNTESILNNGEVHGGNTGIDVNGNLCNILNGGLISGGTYGVVLDGGLLTGQNSLANSGEIRAAIAVSMENEAASFINDGWVTSTVMGSFISISAAVVMSAFRLATFQNSGVVSAAASTGIRFNGAATSHLQFDNSGEINAEGNAVIVDGASDGESDMVNSGRISGSNGALHAGETDVFFNNTATGVLTSSGWNTISTLTKLNLENAGEIAATGQNGIAIRLMQGSALSSITNTGTISSNFAAAIDASAVVSGGGIYLRNFGTVSGSYLGGDVPDYITNRGTMTAIFADAGTDIVRNSGLIDSFVVLSSGNDRYDGRGGEVGDYVDGGQDNDSLRGGAEEDDLRGGIGNDTLNAGAGDDVLSGSTGRDTLSGGAGNDTLTGGTDADFLVGGLGDDQFIFASAAEAGTGALADRISDFNNGNDTMVLSAFMAGGRFIAGAAFAVTGVSEVRYTVATGVLQGDVGGNGTVDWEVVVTNKAALTVSDFQF